MFIFLDTLKHRPYIIGECESNRRMHLYEYVCLFICKYINICILILKKVSM